MSSDIEVEEERLRWVRPRQHPNPSPRPLYDLVVIGGGAAGLVSAGGAAALGARVALVERDKLGGDCLNTGCVPSKALIHEARLAVAKRQHMQGFDPADNFIQAMSRVREKRARIAPHDSVKRLEGYGVDVFFGPARFVDGRSLEVNGQVLRFRKAVVATGGRPALPDIKGLAGTPHHTNESLFEIGRLPTRLSIIGGGPIGCEMAQAFQRLGSRVTLIQSHPRLLEKEITDAAAAVEGALRAEGVKVMSGARVLSVSGEGERQNLLVQVGDMVEDVESTMLLVAAGRKPNIERLELEAAGIRYQRGGIDVDDFLRTSNPRIHACGDVVSRFKFTHVADAQARLAVQNALFWGRRKASRLVVPWVTYTDPEVARVGLSPAEASEAGMNVDILRQDFSHVDRAHLEGEYNGFAEVVLQKGKDRILGATLVHRHAGEMISEITLAMRGGLGLAAFSDTIHPYPTRAEIWKRLGDAYRMRKLTPMVRKLLGYLVRL